MYWRGKPPVSLHALEYRHLHWVVWKSRTVAFHDQTSTKDIWSDRGSNSRPLGYKKEEKKTKINACKINRRVHEKKNRPALSSPREEITMLKGLQKHENKEHEATLSKRVWMVFSSGACRKHKPQPTPEPKRKRKKTNISPEYFCHITPCLPRREMMRQGVKDPPWSPSRKPLQNQ